jgi:TonB family protein
MEIKTLDHMPQLAPPPPVVKPVPKVEKKQPPPKKKGLATKPKPTPVKAKPKAKPLPPKPVFRTKIEIPKFVPRSSEDIVAASPAPGMVKAAPHRMERAPAPKPALLKSRGVRAQDIPFKLSDRGEVSGFNPGAAAVIPVAEERGELAELPKAAVLREAPTGLKTRSGYRRDPGMGSGSGELAGKNKTGYHGAIRTNAYVEGEMAGGGVVSKTASGKGFEIGGPIGDRKILSRRLPEYPAWAEEKGISASVQIFFTVKPDGTVRSTLRVQKSSGYAELDQIAKEALMAWKFSPSKTADENLSWGVITFRFTLN